MTKNELLEEIEKILQKTSLSETQQDILYAHIRTEIEAFCYSLGNDITAVFKSLD